MFDITPYGRFNRNLAFFDPFREIDEIEKRMNSCTLKTDIRETDTAFILEADLPGFAKEDIAAEIKENRLIIKAERKSESENKDEKAGYIRRERSFGTYTRSFNLNGIDTKSIKAAYNNGVLEITLPKIEEKKEGFKKLEII